MTAVTLYGNEIEMARLGRRLHTNGKPQPNHQTISMAESPTGERYVVLCDGQSIFALGTVNASTDEVTLLEMIELDVFEAFPDFDGDTMAPLDWLQSFV